MATLGSKMHRSQTKLVLIVGRHSIQQHQLDRLQVAALSGEVQRCVLSEPVHRVSHQQFVHLKHRPQHLH